MHSYFNAEQSLRLTLDAIIISIGWFVHGLMGMTNSHPH